jgi:hypothetical protein
MKEYSDASDLLSHFGFSKRENKNGSHEIWSNIDDVVVELYYRTNNKRYTVHGMASICKKTGIPLDIARNWPRIPKPEKKRYGI